MIAGSSSLGPSCQWGTSWVVGLRAWRTEPQVQRCWVPYWPCRMHQHLLGWAGHPSDLSASSIFMIDPDSSDEREESEGLGHRGICSPVWGSMACDEPVEAPKLKLQRCPRTASAFSGFPEAWSNLGGWSSCLGPQAWGQYPQSTGRLRPSSAQLLRLPLPPPGLDHYICPATVLGMGFGWR